MLYKRLFPLLLAALLLTGCSGAETKETEKAPESTVTVPETTETEETKLPSSVPEMDLGGEEISILHFQATGYEIRVEELTGDLMNDAVYNANQNSMDTLNCNIAFLYNDGVETTNLQNAYKAGDDIYDIVYGTQYKITPLTLQHMFANLDASTGNHIDYEKPWWYANYIEAAKADDLHTYFLAGDLSPDIMQRSSLLILNTDLLLDIGQDKDALFSTILDGGWTYDVMSELVSLVYVDTNGDGVRDSGDDYGFATKTRSDVDHFLVAAGITICERDENGTPYVAFNNEQTYKCVENLVNLFWNNAGAYYEEGISIPAMLERNGVLLHPNKFNGLNQVRDVDTNYVLIPMPKLDESVDRYRSLVHDDAVIIGIPAISTHVETSTALLEIMARNYYYDVMPEYYNTLIKSKYRRDASDTASQLIDVIHDGLTTDFTYIYNNALSNMITSVRDLVGIKKSTDFASAYASSAARYESGMEKLITALSDSES